MEKKYFIRKFVAGLFFIGCLLMIAGIVFVIGVEKGLTESKFKMTVLYQEVGGLVIGAPVRLSGVIVGAVTDVDFLAQEIEGRSVKVELSLYEKYKYQVHKSVNVAIVTEGVLGEKFIEITTDPNYWQEDLSQPVVGEDPLDMQNLAETFGESAVALLETSKAVDTMTKELKRISITTKRLLNRIEQRIIDGNLFKVF